MPDNSENGFWKSLKPLVKYLALHRRMFAVGLGCAFLTNSIGMLVPLIIKYSIEAVERGAGARIVNLSILGLVGLKLLVGLFRFLMRKILIGISRKIEYRIRADLFEHLETLPPEDTVVEGVVRATLCKLHRDGLANAPGSTGY